MDQTVLTVSRDGFDWASLIFTAVASVGAVGGFLWAIFLYRGEVSHRQEVEADARWAQGRLVTGWVTAGESGSLTIRGGLFLRNGSDQPVYDAVVCFRDTDGRVGNLAIGVLPPNATVERLQRTDGQHPTPGMSVPTAFWFKDAAGSHWFRDWEGELREWPEDNSDPDWWAPMLAKRGLYEGESHASSA